MSLFSGILSLVMAVVLITAVVIPTLKTANTTGWTASEVAVFGLVSVITLLGLAYGAASIFGMV
jgi:hypothetical protein